MNCSTKARDSLIVALDVNSISEAESLAKELSPYTATFKIGFELFLAGGAEIVRRVTATGAGVFLDLKFHDIPNTIASAALVAERIGVKMFNVHAMGGTAMMKRTAAAVQEASLRHGAKRPLILGVTVLTSMNDADLAEVGVGSPAQDQVKRLALLCKASGLDGVVCSAREAAMIKGFCGNDFLTVTPGIRSAGEEAQDQKRTCTAAEAIRAGSDFLVVGRPITKAADPASAAKAILAEIEAAIS